MNEENSKKLDPSIETIGIGLSALDTGLEEFVKNVKDLPTDEQVTGLKVIEMVLQHIEAAISDIKSSLLVNLDDSEFQKYIT